MQTGLAWFHLATACRSSGMAEEAIDAYRRSIACRPSFSLAHEHLGKLLYREGRLGEAAAVYRRWWEEQPHHPIAAHLYAATNAQQTPSRASDGYVTGVFDRAAESYDVALASLGYQVPQLLEEFAKRLIGPPTASARVLDLGCGTGLCGEVFRPFARELIGVDLSAPMLAEARKRKVYGALHCAEITTFLASSGLSFDLIIGADVLCYSGDLEPVLQVAVPALSRGGWLMFSLEELEGDDVFGLQQHGRYAHSFEGVRRMVHGAGLRPEIERTHMLRFERGAPVSGLLVAARR